MKVVEVFPGVHCPESARVGEGGGGEVVELGINHWPGHDPLVSEGQSLPLSHQALVLKLETNKHRLSYHECKMQILKLRLIIFP